MADDDRPTKKEISKRKAAARKARRARADERKALAPEVTREDSITVEQQEDGSFIFHGRAYDITAAKNRALAPYDKIISNYGVQVLLLPDEEQGMLINKTNGCARTVRNDYLNARIRLYDDERKTLSVSEYKKGRLKELKENEMPWLREVDKFALEAALEFVDGAYRNFFEGRADFPKMASKWMPKGNRYTTKFTNNNIDLYHDDVDGCVYLKLPKLGKVKAVIPEGRTVEDVFPEGAKISKATVIKDGRHYKASLCIEDIIDKVIPISSYRADRLISMDMGIRRFCDYDNGSGDYVHVENKRWIRKHAKRLRRFQKALSRKRYDKGTHTGSKNWEKAKRKVAKEQRKVADQRKDFHHWLSHKIVEKCDVFVCEDLNIKGMMQNRNMAKQIASVGWGQFLRFVQYKLERKGGIFLKVDRFFPSSKLCQCGYKNTELKRGDGYWACPICHRKMDRDDNAVDNIRKEGIRLLAERGIMIIAA